MQITYINLPCVVKNGRIFVLTERGRFVGAGNVGFDTSLSIKRHEKIRARKNTWGEWSATQLNLTVKKKSAVDRETGWSRWASNKVTSAYLRDKGKIRIKSERYFNASSRPTWERAATCMVAMAANQVKNSAKLKWERWAENKLRNYREREARYGNK